MSVGRALLISDGPMPRVGYHHPQDPRDAHSDRILKFSTVSDIPHAHPFGARRFRPKGSLMDGSPRALIPTASVGGAL